MAVPTFLFPSLWAIFGFSVLGMSFRWHLRASTLLGILSGLALFLLFATYNDPRHVYLGVSAAFVLGLTGMIISKHHKLPIMALAAGISWLLIFLTNEHEAIQIPLSAVENKTFELITFLLMIMVVVEAGVHYGMLTPVLTLINTNKKRALMFIVGIMSFIMSAVLDNPTTAVIMGIIVAQLTRNPKDRLIFLSVVIAGANAGGMPSVIGNTTSLFLWMGHQITLQAMFIYLIVPALTFMVVIFAWFWPQLTGTVEKARPVPDEVDPEALEQTRRFHLRSWQQRGMLLLVISGIIFIVGTKAAIHFPPWLGVIMLFGVWGTLTGRFNVIKGDHFVDKFSVRSALSEVDFMTIVMFLLLIPLVGAAEYVGLLADVANWLTTGIASHFGETWIVPLTTLVEGGASAFMSNTSLVASNQAMFGDTYGTNHIFWLMLNYTTGVGGALLPIGTAAGMILMSRFHSELTMGAYLRTATLPIFIAFCAGFVVMYAEYLLLLS